MHNAYKWHTNGTKMKIMSALRTSRKLTLKPIHIHIRIFTDERERNGKQICMEKCERMCTLNSKDRASVLLAAHTSSQCRVKFRQINVKSSRIETVFRIIYILQSHNRFDWKTIISARAEMWTNNQKKNNTRRVTIALGVLRVTCLFMVTIWTYYIFRCYIIRSL